MISAISLLPLAGCIDESQFFRPKVTDVAAIQHLGEFRVISAGEYGDSKSWVSYDEAHLATDGEGRKGVHYGQVGAPENVGIYGGLTFTFSGTGGSVCIVMDPEIVFWSQSRKPVAGSNVYLYQDRYEDDGDLDMDGGLSAYYTGSPGVSIGEFEVPYTDQSGQSHTLPANECEVNSQFASDVHSGRGAVESCELDTSGRYGVSYTILLKTFTLPIEDSILNYAVAVFDGPCSGIQIDECTMTREKSLSEQSVDCNDPDEPWTYACLEDKFCSPTPKQLNTYCEEHLDDEDPPCIDNDHVPEAAPEDTGGGA